MKKSLLGLLVILLSISGCNQAPQTIDAQGESVKPVSVNANIPFQMCLPISESPIRGIVVQSESYPNIDNMESGLLNQATNYIDKNLFYQQGEVLSGEDASNLLKHHLSDADFQTALNSDPQAQNIGLNPIVKEDDPTSKNNVVTTLIEQDFYKNKDEKEITAIAIGVGVDFPTSVDEQTGSTKVSDMEKFLTYDGKNIANQISQVVRSKPGYEQIPIMFGFYQQSANPTIPGVYIARGYLNKNDANIQELTSVNQEYIPFLDELGIKRDLDLNNKVQTLKNELINYFGSDINLNALGFYVDNKLQYLDISIIFPSSSIVEGNAIINFIEEQLHSNVNINSKVKVSVVSAIGEPIGSLIKDGNNINKIINRES